MRNESVLNNAPGGDVGFVEEHNGEMEPDFLATCGEGATWFTQITAMTNVTEKTFQDLYQMFSRVGEDRPLTTLELRCENLQAHKDDVARAPTLDTIHCLLAIHGMKPSVFCKFILKHTYHEHT